MMTQLGNFSSFQGIRTSFSKEHYQGGGEDPDPVSLPLCLKKSSHNIFNARK